MGKIPRTEWPKIVRRAEKETKAAIANGYGVTEPAIHYIVNNYDPKKKPGRRKAQAKAATNGASAQQRVTEIIDLPELPAIVAPETVEVTVETTARDVVDANVVLAYRQALKAVVALNTGGDPRQTIDKLIQTLAELRLSLP